VVASHGELIEILPAGFRAVARREHVAADALEHEHLPIFSVQFHPEARADFLAVRGIPPCVHDATAFEDQARLLARFRELAAGPR
jgi:GMP synthase-like glutamine amidotransferase